MPILTAHTSSKPPARLCFDVSPYRGAPDLSLLDGVDRDRALDVVSIADLLRNGCVYPPHTIYRDVSVAGVSFRPAIEPGASAELPVLSCDFPAQWPARPSATGADGNAAVDRYHALLCDAAARTTRSMVAPWLLQSGGKDSTSLAIALAQVRPDTTCLTYRGGNEEDEVASARQVARRLGLRHEALVCDPSRAYERYLALLPRMPLLTADFAMLSYADLAWEVSNRGGDGILDGLGSDPYFGMPDHGTKRIAMALAQGWRLPPALFDLPGIRNSFVACYALAAIQMDRFERAFPGSRFTDAEVDALLGRPLSTRSRQRRDAYAPSVGKRPCAQTWHEISLTLIEQACLAKGLYVSAAEGLQLAFPYCDEALRRWIACELAPHLRLGKDGTNKVIVRRHIARHFGELPYVSAKGSFRFDLRGLARQRFDQVHAFAGEAADLMPGAQAWLETHRKRLDNKYFASKFYLLAVILPWLARHGADTAT